MSSRTEFNKLVLGKHLLGASEIARFLGCTRVTARTYIKKMIDNKTDKDGFYKVAVEIFEEWAIQNGYLTKE